MSYKNFTLRKIKDAFGLDEKTQRIFAEIIPITASDILKGSIKRGLKIPMESEKVRGEVLIMPILLEIREINKDSFAIHSGENLDIDSAQGLNGECDFILNKANTLEIEAPIFTIVEAKQQITRKHIGQCVAQMIGAERFNEGRGKKTAAIFGSVSNGEEWLFLKLEKNTIYIHNEKFYIRYLEEILGVLQQIIDFYK